MVFEMVRKRYPTLEIKGMEIEMSIKFITIEHMK